MQSEVPVIDTLDWHPKIIAMHTYWRSLSADGRRLPSRADVDPTSIPALLANIFMLDVIEAPLRFRYRLVGSKLVSAGGREMKGMLMEKAHPNLFSAQPYADYPACVREHRVSRRLGAPVFDWDREHVRIERLLLPLAADGQHVDTILGLSVFFAMNGEEI